MLHFVQQLISIVLTGLLLLKNPETEPERENMFFNQNYEPTDGEKLRSLNSMKS